MNHTLFDLYYRHGNCGRVDNMGFLLPAVIMTSSALEDAPHGRYENPEQDIVLLASNRFIFQVLGLFLLISFHKTLSGISTYSQEAHGSQQLVHVPIGLIENDSIDQTM